MMSMKREIISQAVGGIDARYIQEAAEDAFGEESLGEQSSSRGRGGRRFLAVSVVAATVLGVLVGGSFLLFSSDREEDIFVKSSDSQAIPWDGLYAQEDRAEEGGGEVTVSSSADAPEMICVGGRLYKRSLDWEEPAEGLGEGIVYLGKIQSNVSVGQNSYATSEDGILTGVWVEDGVPREDFQANTPIVGAEVYQWGEDVVVRVDGEYRLYKYEGQVRPDTEAQTETRTEAQGDMKTEIRGEKVWQGEDSVSVEADSLQAAEAAAKDYYLGTVFGLVSMEVKEQTAEEIIFSVRVTKGGVVQEPDRSITLRLEEGGWKVVNEGY